MKKKTLEKKKRNKNIFIKFQSVKIFYRHEEKNTKKNIKKQKP